MKSTEEENDKKSQRGEKDRRENLEYLKNAKYLGSLLYLGKFSIYLFIYFLFNIKFLKKEFYKKIKI